MCEICSKLTITTIERRRRHSVLFIFNFEQNSHIVLVFLLLTLIKKMPVGEYQYFQSLTFVQKSKNN